MSTIRKASAAALTAALVVLVPMTAFAQEAAAAGAANGSSVKMMAYIGAAIAIGLGVLGGTMGQGRAASSALEGIARNPGAAARIQTPMILGLALIESLVLFALVVSLFILGKI